MIHQIADAAVSSLYCEVLTTPKPGLVDALNSGAHTDMTLLTFFNSAAALSPFFHTAANTGASWDRTLPELFNELRRLGVEAEKQMFRATGGVNTHKGLIFSEGILTAAAAFVYRRYNTVNTDLIFSTAAEMTRESLEKEFNTMSRAVPITHGEKLFLRYGYRGIRGEAQNGFPTVKNISLPALSQYRKQNKDINKSHIQTLFLLMAQVDDTNVLYRSNPETLKFVKEAAKEILDRGGAFTQKGFESIFTLDSIFIEKNISPGGCADLLAVTIMMQTLKQLGDTFREQTVKNSFKSFQQSYR